MTIHDLNLKESRTRLHFWLSLTVRQTVKVTQLNLKEQNHKAMATLLHSTANRAQGSPFWHPQQEQYFVVLYYCLSKNQDNHFVGSMLCYHLDLRLAKIINMLEVCRKAHLDINGHWPDSNLPRTNGTLYLTEWFWIKAVGTNLYQYLCKLPLKVLWGMIVKNNLKNRTLFQRSKDAFVWVTELLLQVLLTFVVILVQEFIKSKQASNKDLLSNFSERTLVLLLSKWIR